LLKVLWVYLKSKRIKNLLKVLWIYLNSSKRIKNIVKFYGYWIYLKSKRIRNIVKSFMDISKIKKCHKDVGTSKIGLATE